MKSICCVFASALLLASCHSSDPPESTNITGTSTSFDLQPTLPCITSVPIPEVVTFAGDTIPVERSDVRQGLEYELMVNTFRHSNTLNVIKNIERWKPLVTWILKDENVPEDFIYLAVIESEFDNNARSYAGAMGLWQIMEKTGKEYNLKMNDDVDMRRDPKLATLAACKYLKWAYGNLGDWTLAAASYNAGVQGMKTRLKEQKVDNFFDLHLNSETARYVYRMVAMKLILQNPKTYGYFVKDEEKYEPYKFTTITVTEDIHNLVDFAKQYNTTYKELRLLNPWFNNTSTFRLKVGKKESFEIRIPVK